MIWQHVFMWGEGHGTEFLSLDEDIVATSNGKRSLEEMEREAYMANSIHEAALWDTIKELHIALEVSARLDE